MLTKDLLNELFWHDEAIGELRWKVKRTGTRGVNSVAGYTISTGYRAVRVNGKQYRVHRLIWTMVVGDIPEGYYIDHIDGNISNNLITNLRLATKSQNGFNQKIRSDNTSGIKGVGFHRASGRWTASIYKDGKRTHAYFATKELAELFVQQARELLHGEFANHGVCQ